MRCRGPARDWLLAGECAAAVGRGQLGGRAGAGGGYGVAVAAAAAAAAAGGGGRDEVGGRGSSGRPRSPPVKRPRGPLGEGGRHAGRRGAAPPAP